MERYGKKKKMMPNKAILRRAELYHQLKSEGVQVQWKTSSLSSLTEQLAITEPLANRPSKPRDAANLRRVLTLPENDTLEMSINDFNHIMHKLPASGERNLLVHVLDGWGGVMHSITLNHNLIQQENVFFSDSGAIGSDAEYTHSDAFVGDFQVYTQEQFKEDPNSQIPCFLYALETGGVHTDLVEQIASEMFTVATPWHFIKAIAETYDLYITVRNYKEFEGRVQSSVSTYGEKTNQQVELGQVAQHLFAIRPTCVTRHALQNHLLKHPAWPAIRLDHGKVVTTNLKFLDSFQVISELFCNHKEILEPITLENAPNLLNNKFQNVPRLSPQMFKSRWFQKIGRPQTKIVDGESVNVIQEKYGSHPFERRKIREKFSTVFYDLETFAELKGRLQEVSPEYALDHHDSEAQHLPYLAAWQVDDGPTQYAFGLDCVTRMLDSLAPKRNYLMWAHNQGFDIRFVLRHISQFSSFVVETGNRMKMCAGSYKGRRLCFKDTMSFINEPLAELPNMFKGACDFPLEKECFPHKEINIDTFDKPMKLSKLKDYEDKDTLIKNASAIGAISNGELDIKKYAIHYCIRDVEVLATCFKKFREMILEKFKQDVNNHISMPGLAYAVFHQLGCYDECYSLSGPVLTFVREAIVGGRVMTRDNAPHHTTHPLSDIDAVSLYPSAMARLPGFVRGKPKLHGARLPKCDYHISRVKILSISKKLHFPLQSIKAEETSTRDFTNDIVGREIILDQYALEDLVEFQGATYEIIEGVFWNDGFNTQIQTSIRKIFDERLSLKELENPLEIVIKLLLNSSYGKLIQKPIVRQKRFVRGADEIKKYTRQRINRLIQRTPISQDLALFEEHKALSRHFSPAHLGVAILSISKRIMNEVMCLAEDLDCNIWYQDTDSMHIDRDKVSELSTAFREKYGRELDGKQLGQLHVDFKLKDREGRKIDEVKIYAEESYFISKKTYVDFLRCDDSDTQGVHMRMKSIPSKLITNPRQTYHGLFTGTDQKFELATVCPLRINSRTQQVMKVKSFPRVVQAVNKR